MWYYYIIGICLIIILSLIYLCIYQKNKYIEESIENNKKMIDDYKKYNFYLKENIKLKKILNAYEEKKYEKINKFNINGTIVNKNPIYKGKRALIGDDLSVSYTNTENALRSLGFDVDIVEKGEDIIEKIKYGEKYDIIFSNRIYRHGMDGSECLKELRKLSNFSTPIVIHTISKDMKDYFVDTIGFDDYIEKPVTQEKLIPVLEKIFNE